ncbi:conserved hypothetical protein (partial), partial [Erwinia amylovora ATCC 49946]
VPPPGGPKLLMLARRGEVRLLALYGLVISQQDHGLTVLLTERISGVMLEVPVRTPERGQQLRGQIVAVMFS